jgi:HlyD family secretion protein
MRRARYIVPAIVVVVVVVFLLTRAGGPDPGNSISGVFPVERGTITEKAVAIGTLGPRQEIEVKSKISGIVKDIFVETGDRVDRGKSLIDIAPDPTPLEYAEAKRNVQLAAVALSEEEKEYKRASELHKLGHATDQTLDASERAYEEAELRLKLAEERLALIEDGRATVADRVVESVIKAPVSGTVLEKYVDPGDPVVPLTSYQAGTRLLSIANLDDIIFKGTVDEIDVGKLFEGMKADIEVGALPEEKIEGVVTMISPKARQQDNTTLFDVEIEITARGTRLLRAGYSANADIIIDQKEDVLLVPERLVHFDPDSSYVEMQTESGEVMSRRVETGLSDGLNVEITSGLDEGDKIIERPPREIS